MVSLLGWQTMDIIQKENQQCQKLINCCIECKRSVLLPMMIYHHEFLIVFRLLFIVFYFGYLIELLFLFLVNQHRFCAILDQSNLFLTFFFNFKIISVIFQLFFPSDFFNKDFGGLIILRFGGSDNQMCPHLGLALLGFSL